jgi:hypothetical protein
VLLHHRELIAFLNGRLGDTALVAKLPFALGNYLNAQTEDVFLGREYGKKLFKIHRLLPHHFYLIQPAIDYGWMGYSRGDLLFLYEDRNIFQKTFKLIIKSTGKKHELWIKTFFKVDAGDIPRILASAQKIRDHLE